MDDASPDNSHALPGHLLAHKGSRILIFFRENFRAICDQGHLAAEALKTLRQLAADRPGADHNHSTRQFCEGKYRFVRIISRVRQSRYGKFCSSCAGGNNGAIEFDTFAVHFDYRWPDKAPVADVDIHSQFAETIRGIVLADSGAQPSHPLHRG